MNYLLDTHTFIWFINGDQRLSQQVRILIEDIENNCFVSIASIWEIGIKISIGKLNFEQHMSNINSLLGYYEIEVLEIDINHIHNLISLPFYHRDPFDRLLIAQSMVENMPLITKDDNIKQYNLKTIW